MREWPVNRPRGVYSQAQQDAILKGLFESIGVTNKFAVEFGFNAYELTGGTGSNVARLVIEDGWRALLFDGHYQNPSIHLYREWITPANLADLFARYEVPVEPDYVSIDVDSIDLWLLRAMFEGGYRPRVVSCEYNPNYAIAECVTVRPGTVNTNDNCYGASLSALYLVGREFGYQMVDVEPGLDVFFLREDVCLFPPLPVEAFAPSTELRVHRAADPARVAAVLMNYTYGLVRA